LDGPVALAAFAGGVTGLFPVLAQAAARAAFSAGGGWPEAGAGLAFCGSGLAFCASSLARRETSSALRETRLARWESSLARRIFDFSSASRAARRVFSLTDSLAPAGAILAAVDEASVEAGAAARGLVFAEAFFSAAGNAAATGIARG
jgi:hypothetical protein